MNDKEAEASRYNSSAALLLASDAWIRLQESYASVPECLREPYIKFEEEIVGAILRTGGVPDVLELCCGTGNFTSIPIRAGAAVQAADIAESALKVVAERYRGALNFSTLIADIEATELPSESFDIIMCAGGLSYGDNFLVLNEIYRLLKPNGEFICVDSLNHNPVYYLNRFLHYLRGRRTWSTLRRMPTIDLLDGYRRRFGFTSVWYFGSLSWAMPLLSKVIGSSRAYSFSGWFDRLIGVRASAFKFVMLVRKEK